MQFKTLAFLASVAPVALADFNVFCGVNCNGFDGSGCATACVFFLNPPSCDDITNSVPFFIEKDVSKCGGVACDGCDIGSNTADWTITRLEIANQQDCDPSHLYWDGGGDNPHFTLYNDNGNVNILDVDGNNVGTCTVPSDPQHVDCPDVYGNSGYINQFSCTSELTYNDAPN